MTLVRVPKVAHASSWLVDGERLSSRRNTCAQSMSALQLQAPALGISAHLLSITKSAIRAHAASGLGTRRQRCCNVARANVLPALTSSSRSPMVGSAKHSAPRSRPSASVRVCAQKARAMSHAQQGVWLVSTATHQPVASGTAERVVRDKQQTSNGPNHLQGKKQPRELAVSTSACRHCAARGTRPWNQRVVEPRDALALPRRCCA